MDAEGATSAGGALFLLPNCISSNALHFSQPSRSRPHTLRTQILSSSHSVFPIHFYSEASYGLTLYFLIYHDPCRHQLCAFSCFCPAIKFHLLHFSILDMGAFPYCISVMKMQHDSSCFSGQLPPRSLVHEKVLKCLHFTLDTGSMSGASPMLTITF